MLQTNIVAYLREAPTIEFDTGDGMFHARDASGDLALERVMSPASAEQYLRNLVAALDDFRRHQQGVVVPIPAPKGKPKKR